jgi:hypothetical protein
MDNRLLIVCWTVGGGVFLGVVGAIFGGLAGFLARTHGRSPGSFLGLRVLRAIEQVQKRPLASGPAGILVGAIDGATFLGTVGILLGWLASRSESIPDAVFIAIFLAIGCIAVLAASVGTTAYLISRGGMRAAWAVCSGGLVGICVGVWAAGAGGVLIGAWLGLLLGIGLGWISSGRKSVREQTSRIEEDEP